MTKHLVLYILLLFIPAAIVSDLIHSDHYVTFIFACVALIPLSKMIGDSTEHLGSHYGATAGSLLNVTFGNAPELIIATSAMNAGLFTLVKASITGSILGNILLILGLSLIAGGFRHKEQRFNKENTGIQTSMLFIAIIGLTIPTIIAATTLNLRYSSQFKWAENTSFERVGSFYTLGSLRWWHHIYICDPQASIYPG